MNDDQIIELIHKLIIESTRWYELFGTPEKAAETLKRMCVSMESCSYCPLYASGADFCECDDGDGIVEWLRGDA